MSVPRRDTCTANLIRRNVVCPPPKDDEDESQEDDDHDHDSHRNRHHQLYPPADGRRSRGGSSRNPRPVEGGTFYCGRCNAEHLQEPLVWALQRTAEREFLRPGPCLDSPGIGWDGLDIERLPPPVDQVGPRPVLGQRGGSASGGRGGLLPPPPPSRGESKEPSSASDTAAAAAAAAAGEVGRASGDGNDGASPPSLSAMFRMARQNRTRGRRSGRGQGGDAAGTSPAVYRVVAAQGVQVRRGAHPQSAAVEVLGEGTEMAVTEELQDETGEVWMRLSSPIEGWASKHGSTLVTPRGSSETTVGTAGRSGARGGGAGGLDKDGSETGEAAEVVLAKELEDCMEEEAGTESYRRDDRLFGSRQGWRLPSGGGSGVGLAGGRGAPGDGSRRADSRVPGERRATVVGHASVSGCWAAMASMSIAAAKQKIAGTAATLAVLHCRKIMLTVLLQCHKEVTQQSTTAAGGQAAADALLSQRVAALVGARDSPLPAVVAKAGGEITASPRASSTTLRTRAASRQFSSFLQLVLFRGWHPGWWPLADSGDRWSESGDGADDGKDVTRNEEEEESGLLDDEEPMPECFRSLPVVITPVVLSLLRAAAAQRAAVTTSPKLPSKGSGAASPRSQSFGAHVEEAMLQSVANQLRLATRIGHGDHAWTAADTAEMSDSHCLRYPRLRYASWAARVVQAGSGAPTVPRRIFHAWATGLRSPSLPVKQQVCSELSRLLDQAVEAVDRAYRTDVAAPTPRVAEGGEDGVGSSAGGVSPSSVEVRASAMTRLSQCAELLPLERLRSLAERRMLKEGEDEPMLSRALQSMVDLVASTELASRVLRERRAEDADRDGDREAKKEEEDTAVVPSAPPVATPASPGDRSPEADPPAEPGRSVLCFPTPAAYVSLQGRDLEPPWTAEFWLLRPNPDGTWEEEDGQEAPGEPAKEGGDADEKEEGSCSVRPLELGPPPAAAPASVPRRGIRKAYSERLWLPPPPASMARATSTPSSSVDLTHLPPMDSDNGAPALTRTRSADAVGQDEADGKAGSLNPDDFPPLPVVPSASAAPRRGNHSRGEGRVGPVRTEGRDGDGGFPSFTGAYGSPPNAPAAGQRSGRPPWISQSHVGGGDGGGSFSRGKERWELAGGSKQAGGAPTAVAAGGAAEREQSMRKGEIGTEPAEYLASSQAGHIRLQTGGTVFADSVGQVNGDGPDRKGDEADEGVVHSEALCMSMGAAGEKDRAFDFVVPTGRWVHLAIVASSAAEAGTTLYADGVAVDTISMRMSLPMGYVGAGPHAQEASAAGSGGGSFVGLLAQTRYIHLDVFSFLFQCLSRKTLRSVKARVFCIVLECWKSPRLASPRLASPPSRTSPSKVLPLCRVSPHPERGGFRGPVP